MISALEVGRQVPAVTYRTRGRCDRHKVDRCLEFGDTAELGKPASSLMVEPLLAQLGIKAEENPQFAAPLLHGLL